MSTTYTAGQRISEYLLEERVGAGTFGEVWKARHHVWEREHVAIKLPTEPDFVRYLQREGHVVHGLKHPNIVRVLGFDPYAEFPYLVMELVRGPALTQAIADHPRGLPIEVVTTVLRGVLNGMIAAHAANIIHRDLKPGNVLLNLDGKPLPALTVEDVKVTDFGLGHAGIGASGSIAQSASLARTDKLVGTLAYMAPETRDAARGAAPDPRNDLFAIGVILFEMLTGERPAGTEMPSALRPEVPRSLDELFEKLYSRLDRRLVSAAAALELLDSGERRWRPPPPLPVAADSHYAARMPRIEAGNRGGTPPLIRTPGSAAARCSTCNELIEQDDQFCTGCGRQVVETVRRCPSCGGFPSPRDQFCIACGAGLAASGSRRDPDHRS